MEILGGLAFAKDEVIFAVPSFRQFLKNALSILPAENAEERNTVEHRVGREAEPFI
jgi:hypothetical protein